jgi:hypothetical protein
MWAPAAGSIAFPLVPSIPSYAHTATAGQAIQPGKGVKARLMLGFCIKPKGFLPYPPMCHCPLQISIANGIIARKPLQEPQATCARSRLKKGIGVSISENRATLANVDRLRDLVLNWISAS